MTLFVTNRIKKGDEGMSLTKEELLESALLSEDEGVLDEQESDIIENILKLDDIKVHDILTPRSVVFALEGERTIKGIIEQEPDIFKYSRIPVYEGDDPEDIVGVIYRRSVFEALADDQDDVKLSELMKPVRFALENITLDKLLVKFLESRMHLFVVLDEYGGMSGVVTLEDVMEEILGSEIVDETDQVVDMRELARRRRKELLVSKEQASADVSK
jgi:CBS domain containing-hemolysin-like protein